MQVSFSDLEYDAKKRLTRRESAPDATTLLKFRRLLEKHKLTASIFETINKHLASKGLMMRGGTVVDATIIAAPRLLHGQERYVFGDVGYQGVEKCRGTKQKRPHWHVAMRPGKRRALPDPPLSRILEKIEY